MTTDVHPITATAAAGGGMDVLSQARQARLDADASEVRVLMCAVDWAVANPPVFAREAAFWTTPGTQGAASAREPLTAEGVPEVDQTAVAELGLALGASTQAARALLADGLELAFRLPTVWTRVVAGEVKPWRARKIAQATRPLGKQAAGYVDRRVAAFADKVAGPTLEGLIEAAMARFDTDLAEQIAAQRAEQRGFDIFLNETGLSGLTQVAGVLDLPDAQDLEVAVGTGGSLAARRSCWCT